MCSHVSLANLLLQQVLHVAILVQDQAAVAALLDAGFSSFDRNSRRWTALDEAIATKHLGITKLLYTHAYAYKKQRMKEKKAQLLGTCNELPNYSVKVYELAVFITLWSHPAIVACTILPFLFFDIFTIAQVSCMMCLLSPPSYHLC